MPKELDNIELAAEITALVFGQCLETHPRPAEVDWTRIVEVLAEEYDFANLETFDLPSIREPRPPFLMSSDERPLRIEGSEADIRDVIHAQLEWLANEGFVRYEPNFVVTANADGSNDYRMRQGRSQTVLTARALAVMNKVPSSLMAKRSLSSSFLSILKGTPDAAAKAAVREGVREMFEFGQSAPV